ncbi:hypothetical protein CkaCkLH20_04290 [Colletotrichum karsti]|uniref:Enoyl reductase (ER) domain-containing protein n=1 Tax=Colletotrichum karsti TaxID=1095194 RepID=A0A9P6LN75_9PEZI|nr:uncharacterized protein CkaCkLH20_04290 [Colletotrichum karsti]KAF9878252.1 hypothetical protein CkaCkLH20_04290 [Colletotrichum karsti]
MRATKAFLRAIPLGMRSVAWVTNRPKRGFNLQTIYLDEVRDDEVLVEMKYSGICHTDIMVSQGVLDMVEFPAIFGHEGAGVIRAIGEKVKDKNLSVGDSVVLSYSTCNTCPACNRGQRYFCHSHASVNHNAVRLSDRTTPARLEDGTPVRAQYFGHSSFAKHSVVHEDTIVKCNYPESLKKFAPLGCGFQTGAGSVLNVLNPPQHSSVAVFGLGTVGLAAVMALKHLGVRQVIAVDMNPRRLALALELGASRVINGSETKDVAQAVQQSVQDQLDYAIECTGSTAVMESCIDAVGNQGRVISLGVPKPGSTVSLDALSVLLQNKSYQGIIQGAANPHEVVKPVISWEDVPIEP